MTWIESNESAMRGARWVQDVYESHSWNVEQSGGIGGRLWINPDSGDQIALLADGGWRMEKNGHHYRSRFRVFRHSQTSDSIEEISSAFLSSHEGDFDEKETGSGRYSAVQEQITEKINHVLDAVDSDGNSEVNG